MEAREVSQNSVWMTPAGRTGLALLEDPRSLERLIQAEVRASTPLWRALMDDEGRLTGDGLALFGCLRRQLIVRSTCDQDGEEGRRLRMLERECAAVQIKEGRRATPLRALAAWVEANAIELRKRLMGLMHELTAYRAMHRRIDDLIEAHREEPHHAVAMRMRAHDLMGERGLESDYREHISGTLERLEEALRQTRT